MGPRRSRPALRASLLGVSLLRATLLRERSPRRAAPRALGLVLLTSGYLALAAGIPGRAADNSAGAKGAQVYCIMRSNGNNHQVSWDAAYALIKRQSASLFKTSPEHGAVMITEAVVQSPGTYPDCARYLGDLYAKPATAAAAAPSQASGGQSRSQLLGS